MAQGPVPARAKALVILAAVVIGHWGGPKNLCFVGKHRLCPTAETAPPVTRDTWQTLRGASSMHTVWRCLDIPTHYRVYWPRWLRGQRLAPPYESVALSHQG